MKIVRLIVGFGVKYLYKWISFYYSLIKETMKGDFNELDSVIEFFKNGNLKELKSSVSKKIIDTLEEKTN